MDSFEHPTSRDKAKWILRDLVDILSNYYTLIELEEDQKKKDKLIEMAADIKSHMNFLQESDKSVDVFEISFLDGLSPKIKKKESKK